MTTTICEIHNVPLVPRAISDEGTDEVYEDEICPVCFLTYDEAQRKLRKLKPDITNFDFLFSLAWELKRESGLHELGDALDVLNKAFKSGQSSERTNIINQLKQ